MNDPNSSGRIASWMESHSKERKRAENIRKEIKALPGPVGPNLLQHWHTYSISSCKHSVTSQTNAMEDSFRVRVDRAFGSLPLTTTAASASTSSSSLTSLWSLTSDEINTVPSNRTNRTESEPEPEPEPYQSWSSGAASSSSSSTFRVELEKDLEDLDEDEEEGFRRAPSSKPDDYDDEQWQIRSGIGLDCTLDYEEEEDHYDKQAIGKENQGDRVYMKDISDDGVEIDNCNSLPTTFGDYVRDPRANHLAARMRLKQDDDEAAKKIDGLHVSDDKNKSAPDIGGGDGVNPKSILKSNDNHPSEHKSQKRVRFDPEFDDKGNEDEHEATRDVRMKTTSMEEEAGLDQSSKSKEFASAVPDYIRNPSRYTRYSFDDSPSDMDDKSNKQAYMSFLSQLKGSNAGANGTESHDGALDDLPAVTFISKKKAGDVTMGENEILSKQKTDLGKEHRRGFTVSIAAGESESSDVCAMEEDEPEAIEEVKKSSQRLNRKYRKKTQEEEEDPTA